MDASADKILGAYLFDRDKAVLYELTSSGKLWRQRAAVMATFYFIRNGQYQAALARMLINHEHDLIHKAVGWILREIGKRDFSVRLTF